VSEDSVGNERAVSQPQSATTLAAVTAQASSTNPDDKLDWPPGAVGETARFIYHSAPRPVREVAIVAALGLHAGILGRQWQIDGSTGLNLYVVLVAPSGIGKEAMHSGISSLLRAMQMRYLLAGDFVDFKDYASGPALVKAVAERPCFVNVCGEWGHKLRRLAEDKRGTDIAMQSLRKEMTNLYSKSGQSATVGGIGYSDTSTNVNDMKCVAYSMIGETTPPTFYNALTTSIMSDGFMSRLCIVEYSGPRPPLNTTRQSEAAEALAIWLTTLAWHAKTLASKNEFRPVEFDSDADELIGDFELECDRNINSTKDESYRQAWNRAALKVRRITGLFAASDEPMRPIGTLDHMTWALTLVRRDIATFMRRWEAGDIGDADDDHKRRMKMMDFLRKARLHDYNKVKDARTRKLLEKGVVPLKHIQQGLSNQAAFTNHKLGQNAAIKATLRDLCESGVLHEVMKTTLTEQFDYNGKAYTISDPSEQ